MSALAQQRARKAAAAAIARANAHVRPKPEPEPDNPADVWITPTVARLMRLDAEADRR